MFLKNKNIIFKTRRSKVTDYAALSIPVSPVYINALVLFNGKSLPNFVNRTVIRTISIFIKRTVVTTKIDSDVIFCVQLLRKTLTCTLHLHRKNGQL